MCNLKNYSMYQITCSENDIAGRNIASIIMSKYNFKRIRESLYKLKNINLFISKGSVLNAKHISDEKVKINFFVSRHSSEKKVKSLTCHSPGNFGEAKYGGIEGVLSFSNAIIQSSALRFINEARDGKNQYDYDVCFEVTHHGPSLSGPCLFLEVGGTVDEWRDLSACATIADVVIHLIQSYEILMKKNKKVCIGFGGPHYAPNFTRFVLENDDYAVGHICPKYNLKNIDNDMFMQMIKKTVPEPSIVLLDWKGMDKESRERITSFAEENNLKVERL